MPWKSAGTWHSAAAITEKDLKALNATVTPGGLLQVLLASTSAISFHISSMTAMAAPAPESKCKYGQVNGCCHWHNVCQPAAPTTCVSGPAQVPLKDLESKLHHSSQIRGQDGTMGTQNYGETLQATECLLTGDYASGSSGKQQKQKQATECAQEYI